MRLFWTAYFIALALGAMLVLLFGPTPAPLHLILGVILFFGNLIISMLIFKTKS